MPLKILQSQSQDPLTDPALEKHFLQIDLDVLIHVVSLRLFFFRLSMETGFSALHRQAKTRFYYVNRLKPA